MKKEFITGMELSEKDAGKILSLASRIKKNPEKFSKSMGNMALAMLFQKNSTRTRMSFDTGMAQLGGRAVYLDWKTTNFELGSIQDEIRSLEKYCDAVMARVFSHEMLVEMAGASSKPIINGLCNLFHPCQALADYLTIKEKLGGIKGKKIAFIGDGNNVCNSLIIGSGLFGADISVATPKGFEPLFDAIDFAASHGSEVSICSDAKTAAKNADIVYTDTWVSMGQEAEKEKRLKIFKPFQVTKKLLGNAFFMHCLPAHRGLEATNEVIDSKKSIIFDQAENRLHAQKALLLWLFDKK